MASAGASAGPPFVNEDRTLTLKNDLAGGSSPIPREKHREVNTHGGSVGYQCGQQLAAGGLFSSPAQARKEFIQSLIDRRRPADVRLHGLALFDLGCPIDDSPVITTPRHESYYNNIYVGR